jgi:ElaB/YqjD/DUF883 family membrane-anchored ribosome-binding protein
MKTGKLDSKLDMGTMSPTARERMAQNRSEKRFLVDQATDARTAMMQTVREMKHTLAQAADVRTCARLHPWIATGSAVAAGFVAGAVLPSSRSTSGARSPATANAGAPPDSTEQDPARAKSGFLLDTLGTALTGIVQTLLQSFIAAAVVATEVDQVKVEPRTPGNSTPCASPPPNTLESSTP